MKATTGTTNTTQEFEVILTHEDATIKHIFEPCRCGKTHTGPYAIYDWVQCNCFHNEPLKRIEDDESGYLMCVDCGKVFWEESAWRQFCPRCNTKPCACDGEKYVPPQVPKLTAREILNAVVEKEREDGE